MGTSWVFRSSLRIESFGSRDSDPEIVSWRRPEEEDRHSDRGAWGGWPQEAPLRIEHKEFIRHDYGLRSQSNASAPVAYSRLGRLAFASRSVKQLILIARESQNSVDRSSFAHGSREERGRWDEIQFVTRGYAKKSQGCPPPRKIKRSLHQPPVS